MSRRKNNVSRLVEFPYEVEKMVHDCIIIASCSILNECKRDLAEMRNCQSKGLDAHAEWWHKSMLHDLKRYRMVEEALNWYIKASPKKGRVCRKYYGVNLFK